MTNALLALTGTAIALAYLAKARKPGAKSLLLCLFECFVALAMLAVTLD